MLPLPIPGGESKSLFYGSIVLAACMSFLFAVMVSRSCSQDDDDELAKQKDAELGRIERLIEDNEARAQVLQDQIDEIQVVLEGIHNEIEESAVEREDLHGVVDGAGSIRELDRILKKRKRERSK